MVETGKKKKWKAMLFLLHSLSLVQRLNKWHPSKMAVMVLQQRNHLLRCTPPHPPFTLEQYRSSWQCLKLKMYRNQRTNLYV